MTRIEANLKMKDKTLRQWWIMEARGEDIAPTSTKFYKGFLYVVWPEDHFLWTPNEAEVYDTANTYGECEDVISLEAYKKLKSFTPYEQTASDLMQYYREVFE